MNKQAFVHAWRTNWLLDLLLFLLYGGGGGAQDLHVLLCLTLEGATKIFPILIFWGGLLLKNEINVDLCVLQITTTKKKFPEILIEHHSFGICQGIFIYRNLSPHPICVVYKTKTFLISLIWVTEWKRAKIYLYLAHVL